jgi:tetratricopeptide (TPR) repeat protein
MDSKKKRFLLYILCLWMEAAWCATPQDAARLEKEERFGEAAAIYEGLIKQAPQSIRLRLDLASSLAKDRQWARAIEEYKAVLKLSPRNSEALRGLGTVQRWQGDLREAKQTYLQVLAQEPDNSDASLGLAATYNLDHDFTAAQKIYDGIVKKSPQDKEAQQAAYDFTRRRNPSIYLFYEDDLSFTTKQTGVLIPFLDREQVGVEHLEESHPNSYTRTDQKILYTHFFGLDHSLDASVRKADFAYPVPPPDFSAIDHFAEYRLRYIYPIIPEQVIAVRYTARPTVLKTTQESFTSHKIEAEIGSSWNPRFQTIIGSGWLRDLNGNATTINDMTNNTLVKLGLQVYIGNRLQISAKHITNPDLDNSISSTRLLQADYTFTDIFSGIARQRHDDYKVSADQNSLYVGLRWTPNSHLWSEFGVKYVERGLNNGTFPLASLVWRF